MVHLVYCDNKSKEIDKIINGSQSMIIRGAKAKKIPYGRVFIGERLYFIEKGTKKIYLTAIVSNVESYTKLEDDKINSLIEENNNKLLLTDAQKERWHKPTLSFIEFSNVEKIDELEFEHQNNMDDWLILEKIEDVVKGSSTVFNYNNSRMRG